MNERFYDIDTSFRRIFKRRMVSFYYNGAGQRFGLPERPLEPPDCWVEDVPEQDEPEYDRAEDEMNGIFNRSQATPCY